MMSAWNLLWICPLCGAIGAFLTGILIGGTRPDPPEAPRPWDPNETYSFGDLVLYRGKILKCEIPGRAYNCSWDPDKYPLAWEEVTEK